MELLGIYGEVNALEEKNTSDFMSRRDFVNAVGIYVTPEYFRTIYKEWKDSGATPEQFAANFTKNHSGEINEVPLTGAFRYMMQDLAISGVDLGITERIPSFLESMDLLAQALYHKSLYADGMVKEYRNLTKDMCAEIIRTKERNGSVS